VDTKAQQKRNILPGLPLLATALLLSATAHAASNAVVPCEQVGRDLQSLEVPVDELAVEGVDHAPIDPEIIDAQTAMPESVAPVLNLGPRVTNILRDVFDMTTEELVQETSEQPSSSPLADSDQKTDTVEPDDANGEESELPRFQRQMLRTDI
jgi:hypothetical protein